MVRKLLDWDGLGTRDGLFAFEPITDLGRSLAVAGADSLAILVSGLGQCWLGVVLVTGILYHFLPPGLVNVPMASVLKRAPAPFVGLLVALVVALLSQLLNGPRANIYFAF